MASCDRIPQTRAELRDALREQVSLLMSHCEHYDTGEHYLAKLMAAGLRICLHHHGRSASLLQQLRLRDGRFYTVAPEPQRNQVPLGCGLVAMSFTDEKKGHYVPLLSELGHRDRVPFPEWWGGMVLRAPTGERMSRRDIVTAVADMDGGAHVDPTLDRTYAAFRSGTLLGMRAHATEDGQIKMVLPIHASREQADSEASESDGLLVSPQYPSIRTITHELLLTLGKYAPWAFGRVYVLRLRLDAVSHAPQPEPRAKGA